MSLKILYLSHFTLFTYLPLFMGRIRRVSSLATTGLARYSRRRIREASGSEAAGRGGIITRRVQSLLLLLIYYLVIHYFHYFVFPSTSRT